MTVPCCIAAVAVSKLFEYKARDKADEGHVYSNFVLCVWVILGMLEQSLCWGMGS